MNWKQVEGQWDQFKGRVQSEWGKLTDDDVDKSEGRREQLVGALKERYGKSEEWADRQVDDFLAKL